MITPAACRQRRKKSESERAGGPLFLQLVRDTESTFKTEA